MKVVEMGNSGQILQHSTQNKSKPRSARELDYRSSILVTYWQVSSLEVRLTPISRYATFPIYTLCIAYPSMLERFRENDLVVWQI